MLAGALGLELSEDFTLVALPQDAAESVPAPDAGPSAVTHSPIEDDVGAREGSIIWSSMRRGMDPRVWLTLAVAAYHERYAS